LPVTHPDMERYFMSAAEACSLILQTLVMDDGPVYVFRMGEPVRIDWLAREMVRRRRPGLDPDVLIRYTGRRPGEKLTERLAMPYETAHPTAHPGVVALRGTVPYSRAELDLHLRALKDLCHDYQASPARLRKALFAEHLASGRDVGRDA
jgi:FlaA1/EpsC-like NDP-sugar epimerase